MLGRGAVAGAPVVLAVDAAAHLLPAGPGLFRSWRSRPWPDRTLGTLLTVWLNSGERRQIVSLARRLSGPLSDRFPPLDRDQHRKSRVVAVQFLARQLLLRQSQNGRDRRYAIP